MARVYICLARNDMDGHLLQILDLKPNSSQPGNLLSSVSLGVGVQSGETGYQSYMAQMDAVVLHAAGAGAFDTNATYYGLPAYLIDNVNNTTGDVAISATQALNIARRISGRMANAQDVSLNDINVAIRAEGADGGFPALGATSTLNGAGAPSTRSTGSVTDVLRILSGGVYMVPGNSLVIGNGGIFPWDIIGLLPAAHYPTGDFTTLPVPNGTVQDLYRDVRRFHDTGALYRSATVGVLSKLKDPAFVWHNPLFTYGPTGTALTFNGVNIGTTGAARAVTVYALDGSVI